ncbi:MAG: helix-turn-helix domain-containing protein [Alphaproteobacteria bacterium]|nr:MAG: helix-turn-helix domain-containing protein [Alphaproteobacteria bacterium]
MSIQAVAWVLGLYIPDPHAKLILLSLANHADHETGFCYPPMRMIASEASCDRRTVLRKIPMLEEAGFLRVIQKRNGKERLAHTKAWP